MNLDEAILEAFDEYGHSADAINERCKHRLAFTSLVNNKLASQGSSIRPIDQVTKRVISLRKQGLLKGVVAEEEVLMIPTVFDRNIVSLISAYRRITGAEIEQIVGMSRHRFKITELFNEETGAIWEEDKVIVRIVQLRKSGKLRLAA